MSRWQDFCFPDIALVPAAKGVRGLYAALEERESGNRLSKEYEFNPEYLAQEESGRYFCVRFDERLKDAASSYVLEDETKPESQKDRYYDATLENMAKLLDENLIDPRIGDLSPDWCCAWAIQRYKFVNLLKLHRIPVSLTGNYISGSVHNGKPMSPNAAMNAALSDAVSYGKKGGTVSLSRTMASIYGPHHGWEEGSYCADAYQVGDVKLNLESLLDENGELPKRMLVLIEITAPYNDPEKFDSFGTGLSIGINYVDVQTDGTIYNWSLPGSPDKQHTLPGLADTTFGFYGSCFALADVSSRFDFYDEIKKG